MAPPALGTKQAFEAAIATDPCSLYDALWDTCADCDLDTADEVRSEGARSAEGAHGGSQP